MDDTFRNPSHVQLHVKIGGRVSKHFWNTLKSVIVLSGIEGFFNPPHVVACHGAPSLSVRHSKLLTSPQRMITKGFPFFHAIQCPQQRQCSAEAFSECTNPPRTPAEASSTNLPLGRKHITLRSVSVFALLSQIVHMKAPTDVVLIKGRRARHTFELLASDEMEFAPRLRASPRRHLLPSLHQWGRRRHRHHHRLQRPSSSSF
jgi:hypothetical protein